MDENTSSMRYVRPASARTVRAYAGRHAKEAVQALAEIINADSAPPADRVRAAETLLAHATASKAA